MEGLKIINRKSPEVINVKPRNLMRDFVTVGPKVIYFTSQAAVNCGISSGLFMHFLNEGSEWSFYLNDDPEGFPITVANGTLPGRSNFRINHTGLVNMILKSTGFNKQKRFAIVKTDRMHDHSPIFKLSLEGVSTAGK